jgi:hypothetical protein
MGSAWRGNKRLSAIWVVLVTMLLLAACGGAKAGGRPLPPELSLRELQQSQPFYQGEYLGRRVAVTGKVAEMHEPRWLEVSSDTGGEKLTVLTLRPVTGLVGDAVRVTGNVGQLHHVSPSDRVPYLQEDLYSQATTQAYLYDAVVEPMTG